MPVAPVESIYERFVAAIQGTASADPDFELGSRLQFALDTAERSHLEQGAFSTGRRLTILQLKRNAAAP